MRLDATTLRDLEVLKDWTGAASGAAVQVCARHASTAAGKALLKEWFRRPLVLSRRGDSVDESRRRRGCHVEISWRHVAATPRVPHG